MASHLTIGIPTLNRAQLVCSLVERCLAQSVAPFGVVVSDDASDDGTFEDLQKYSADNLKLMRQAPRLGMINNWNACLDACQSEWFMLLSDDDMIGVNFVELFEVALKLQPDADIVVMRGRIVDKITGEINENYPPVKSLSVVNFARDILPAWLDYSFALPFASMVFRTDTLRARGGFSKKLPYAADVATWLPIAMNGRAVFVPDSAFDCVVHTGMATRTFDITTLIDDAVKLTDMVRNEAAQARFVDSGLTRKLDALADVYLRNIFGHLMIASARSGASKRRLALAWVRRARSLPMLGLGPLSLGAVFVPQSLIQMIGWPYRRWVSWKRQISWKRGRN